MLPGLDPHWTGHVDIDEVVGPVWAVGSVKTVSGMWRDHMRPVVGAERNR